MNLTDKEKEEIKSLIARNEFLPKKYKRRLFQNVPAKRKERDEIKCSAALKHVKYEHDMLKFTAEAVKCFLNPTSAVDTQAFDTCSNTPMNWTEYSKHSLDALLSNSSADRKNLQNALLESFLIHFRNLLDFYYKDKKDDDMVAGDFPEWNISPAIPDSLATIKKKVNKNLSHLTWARVENPVPKWEYEQIKQMENEIEKIRTTFSEKLPINLKA